MRERWPLSIVGEGLRPARLAPPQVWAELPLKRCHAQAVRAAMLLRLRQEPPTVAEKSWGGEPRRRESRRDIRRAVRHQVPAGFCLLLRGCVYQKSDSAILVMK